MVGKKLEKILDTVEKLYFRYVPDTSGYDEYPNDYYEASEGNLTFKMSCPEHLYVYKRFGDNKEQILCINKPKERLSNIYYKMQSKRLASERAKKDVQETAEKKKIAKIKRQGYEGNIDDVSKRLG